MLNRSIFNSSAGNTALLKDKEMNIMNELKTYKENNNLTNVQLAEKLGVTTRTIQTMLTRPLKPMESLALSGLKSSLDRRSHHVSIEVKYGSSQITVSREGRNKKKFARDYQYNFSDQALIVAREYVNSEFSDSMTVNATLVGTSINNGDHWVFALDFMGI